MSQTASVQRYNSLSQLFHWVVAVLIVGLIVTDTLREGSPKDSIERTQWLHLHMSLGILLFGVAIVRIGWSRLTPRPAPVPGARWTQVSAQAAHVLLNLATLLIPVFGYLRVVSKGRTVEFFGTQLPSLIGESPKLNDLMHIFHGEPMELVLYSLLGLHILAALWHQYFLRDRTLERMLPWGRPS